ncbi:unnamed protein product [Mortierella alpina]
MESSGHQFVNDIANSKESPSSSEQQRQSMLLQLEQLQEQEQQFQQESRDISLTTRARRPLKSSSSAYSAWARAQATGSAYLLIGGGTLCLLFPDWWSGAYSIAIGLVIRLAEQKPTRHHLKNNTLKASANRTLKPQGPKPYKAALLLLMPPTVLRSPLIRSLFYILAALPCFLSAPNFSGGLSLVSAGLTYLAAAIMDRRRPRKSL